MSRADNAAAVKPLPAHDVVEADNMKVHKAAHGAAIVMVWAENHVVRVAAQAPEHVVAVMAKA